MKFHKIQILQALGENDIKTGAKLEEDIDNFISFYDSNDIEVSIENTLTKDDFIIQLKRIKNKILSNGNIPLLHIEAHGSSDKKGIIFPNEDFMSWLELKPFLIEINKASRFNLFVVFAMCNGANFIEALKINDRCPCVGLLGPIEPVDQIPLLTTFTRFYEILFKSKNIIDAVNNINLMDENKKSGYFITSAYLHYHKIIERIKEDNKNKKTLEHNARIIYRKAKKDGLTPLPKIGAIKRRMKKLYPKFIEEIRNHYLMLDLFPENLENLH